MAESRVPMTIRDFFFDDPFFKTSWEDFDTVRERMFTEPRDQWKKFDQDFRESACMSNNIMLNSDSKSSSSGQPGLGNDLERQTSLNKWENGWMFPRRWMLPSLKNEFADMNLFSGKDSEVIRVKQDDNKMEVSLDTSQYRPDELSVSVSEGTVSVEGKHEEKAEDGSKMVSRQFVRKYTLPAGAKPQDISSNLSSDGSLLISAGRANPIVEVKIV